MHIEYSPNFTKNYNPALCEELGVEVPDDYVPIGEEAEADDEAAEETADTAETEEAADGETAEEDTTETAETEETADEGAAEEAAEAE